MINKILIYIIRFLYRNNLRGQTRITLALAKRFRFLQSVPVELDNQTIVHTDLRLISSHGVFVDQTLKVFEEKIFRKTIKSGDIIFDIGAHIGLYSIFFSDIVGKDGKVFSFEPNSEASHALTKTIAKLDNAILLPFGLSDKYGESLLYIPEDASAASLSDWTKNNMGSVHQVSCELQRLDDLLEKEIVPFPDFIKCDVEGAEELVFRGAKKMLNSEHPPIILFEVNKNASKSFNLSERGVMDLLSGFEKARYNFFDAQTEKLSPISDVPQPLPNALAVNILAVPRSRMNRLE